MVEAPEYVIQGNVAVLYLLLFVWVSAVYLSELSDVPLSDELRVLVPQAVACRATADSRFCCCSLLTLIFRSQELYHVTALQNTPARLVKTTVGHRGFTPSRKLTTCYCQTCLIQVQSRGDVSCHVTMTRDIICHLIWSRDTLYGHVLIKIIIICTNEYKIIPNFGDTEISSQDLDQMWQNKGHLGRRFILRPYRLY
jgi:hypothetical protein